MSDKEKNTTPWKIEFDGEVTEVISSMGCIIMCDTPYYPTPPDVEDMKHIVKCVNMHDDLVEALNPFISQGKELDVDSLKWRDNDIAVITVTIGYLREVLKKAGAL